MKKQTRRLSSLQHVQQLAQNEIAQLKGGRRFIAMNRKKVMAKKQELEIQGHAVSMAKHGDKYCIEW